MIYLTFILQKSFILSRDGDHHPIQSDRDKVQDRRVIMPSDMILVTVDSVSYDEKSSLFRVALKDQETGKVLPIFVGTFEGNAITIAIREIPTARPLTHDLMASVISKLKGSVNRILVADLRDNIYFAYIYIQMGEKDVAIDSRPSDAIALATRLKVPIYVSEKLRSKFVDEYEEILTRIDPGETVH
jgi:bifunctional DNase/RNase